MSCKVATTANSPPSAFLVPTVSESDSDDTSSDDDY